MKPISICIPASNEEVNIGGALDSVQAQESLGELEIIVCVNGCTDRTATIVKERSMGDPRIRLLESEHGKPYAWNRLFEEARHDYLIFLDGDVVARKDALRQVYDDLEKGLVLSGGIAIPNLSKVGLLTKLIWYPRMPANSDCVIGALYGVERRRLREKMREKGYVHMPVNLVGDDQWLALVVGKDSWKLNPQAAVFYTPPDIVDLYRYIRRVEMISYQLAREHPHLAAEDGVCERISYKTERGTVESVVNYTTKPFRFALFQTLRALAKLTVYDDYARRSCSSWEPLKSTKI